MKRRPRPRFLLWLPLALLLISPGAAGPIPGEVFTAPPDFSGLNLSPDGTRLALLTPAAGGVQSLVVMDLATKELKGIRSAPGHDIRGYRWLENGGLLFSVSIRRLYAGGLYLADACDLRARALNEYDVTRLVDPLPAEPHRAWTTHRQGRVRLAQVEREDTLNRHHRENDAAAWEPLLRGEDAFAPWVFDADGSLLVFAQQGHDSAGIVRMGGSFGGYLALCGAAFEPDRYRCAVTIVGVFDWEQLIRDKRRTDEPFAAAFLDRGLTTAPGPHEDGEAFTRLSPIHHADTIRIPVFVAHGTDDANVSVAQSRRLVRERKTRGVPHETMFKANEGHGFAQPENRLELFERVERFLAQHLR